MLQHKYGWPLEHYSRFTEGLTFDREAWKYRFPPPYDVQIHWLPLVLNVFCWMLLLAGSGAVIQKLHDLWLPRDQPVAPRHDDDTIRLAPKRFSLRMILLIVTLAGFVFAQPAVAMLLIPIIATSMLVIACVHGAFTHCRTRWFSGVLFAVLMVLFMIASALAVT